MDLSIVIVNYNVRHFLEQCLKSVGKASESISCEIFVVDNNSADGSCSMVTTSFPEIILIRNNENKGFSAACNQAIKMADGDFILLLNPDTVVEEDTFIRCIKFMQEHTDAGALGVKMLNGNGKLLPESKRALPTPATAFFKVTGFSGLFPRSGFFNRYYLGHLDSSVISEAEVISGAFMFIRKEAIGKTGPLDEAFFMYGEDIDLSYRLIKAGYKNYYFPGVKIIHYKGESTSKGDFNHILHFYKAMLIFIRKHFTGREYRPFLLFIRIAIYILGTAAVLKNIVRKYFLPLADSLVIFLIFIFLIPAWGKLRFGESYSYPGIFALTVIPFYIVATIGSIFLSGGYRLPSRPVRVIKGLLSGLALVLVIYALLPPEFRFSRAVIVIGGLSTTVIILLLRVLMAAAGIKAVINPFARAARTVIVSDDEEFIRISDLIGKSAKKHEIAGRVGINPDDLSHNVLGTLQQIKDIIRINRITEVVFSTRELSASQIIESMHLVSECNIDIKIAPTGENILIGSKSVSSYVQSFQGTESSL